VNAYEVKAVMVFFAGKKLCDPCLSALEWFVPCKALYKCSDLPLPFSKNTLVILYRGWINIQKCSPGFRYCSCWVICYLFNKVYPTT